MFFALIAMVNWSPRDLIVFIISTLRSSLALLNRSSNSANRSTGGCSGWGVPLELRGRWPRIKAIGLNISGGIGG
jgi:hypothetical protein